MQLAQFEPVTSPQSSLVSESNSCAAPDRTDLVLVGIKVELRSQEDSEKSNEQVRSALGPHFKYYSNYDSIKECNIVRIMPQDYCKVDGGMMFTTAGSILGDLIAKGMQIISMNPLFEK